MTCMTYIYIYVCTLVHGRKSTYIHHTCSTHTFNMYAYYSTVHSSTVVK